MRQKQSGSTGIQTLFYSDQIRRFDREGQSFFAAADVVTFLNDGGANAEVWADLLAREPELAKIVQTLELPAEHRTSPEVVDVVDRAGIMRIVQAVHSPRAERLRAWQAATAVEWLDEDANPELAALRARRLYESRGFHRRWVAKRLRGADARHEATGEWYKRGIKDSDHFRGLTNALFEEAFGMDVTQFRQRKGLTRTNQSLRDHMTDLELALTELAETLAVSLHRGRRSQGFEELLRDVRDAGRIVRQARGQIEEQLSRATPRAA